MQFEEVRSGLGMLDFDAFLTGINALSNDVPIMIEHLDSQKEYSLARDYIKSKAKNLGINL